MAAYIKITPKRTRFKILNAISPQELEEKLNSFLEIPGLERVDTQFTEGPYSYTAYIKYNLYDERFFEDFED